MHLTTIATLGGFVAIGRLSIRLIVSLFRESLLHPSCAPPRGAASRRSALSLRVCGPLTYEAAKRLGHAAQLDRSLVSSGHALTLQSRGHLERQALVEETHLRWPEGW